MPTSVQSAVTMLQDTTMGSGHVKAAKRSLKGVFKVGESAFDNSAQISCFLWSAAAAVDLAMSRFKILVYGAVCWKQSKTWLLYLLALMLSRSGSITKWAIDFFREEVEYIVWQGPAAKASVGWHCNLRICWPFVSQSRHSNYEFVRINAVRVGNCLETLLARSYSSQEYIAWSCGVNAYNIYAVRMI